MSQLKTKANILDKSTHSQCIRLLNALQEKSITTIEAQNNLDIQMPAARVLELKADGYVINTAWTSVTTIDNRKHRIARYTLVREVDPE